MSDVLWRRLGYMLSPQLDIYRSIGRDLLPDDQVLEAGFGTGLGTVQLAQIAHVDAWEINADAVDFARKVLPLPKVNWSCHDFTEFFGAGQYSAVVMVEVLEHIPEWQLALQTAAQHLEADGRLYISARNANADLRRNDLHEREWTAAEFRAALAGYFSDVKLYDYTLANEQGDDSRVTPLVAVAVK